MIIVTVISAMAAQRRNVRVEQLKNSFCHNPFIVVVVVVVACVVVVGGGGGGGVCVVVVAAAAVAFYAHCMPSSVPYSHP